MDTLPVHLFKDSFGPFVALLNEKNIEYRIREQRSGRAMAASGVVEIVLSPEVLAGLA